MTRFVAIFDIDSTLANNGHRAALLRKRCSICLHEPMPVGHHAPCPSCGGTDSTHTQESWDAFLNLDLMAQDTPIPQAVEVLERLRELGAEIHFITGRRRSRAGAVTEDWLRHHCKRDEENEILLMREDYCTEDDNDLVPASVYKGRAIKRMHNLIGDEGVFFFFEDDHHVFPVYDKYGIVIRCPQGWQHFMPPGARYAEQIRNP